MHCLGLTQLCLLNFEKTFAKCSTMIFLISICSFCDAFLIFKDPILNLLTAYFAPVLTYISEL